MKKIIFPGLLLFLFAISVPALSQNRSYRVSDSDMSGIYNEVKTPFKYGIVFKHPDTSKLVDSPSIYRYRGKWFMTYIVFDGKGYETWLAESKDLIGWKTKGKILSFSENTWDLNQKAGYMSLVDFTWEGSYKAEKHGKRYWMSYLGGNSRGYESGILKVGIANSKVSDQANEWTRLPTPVLQPGDDDTRWFEKKTIYKSLVIHDSKKFTGHEFVMYYNAKGDTADYESIGMAVSDDMVSWHRFGNDPVITCHKGICGDAQIARIGNIYVMFYFGAFWKPGAFDTFACSYDLIHWTPWKGNDLIEPSEEYDRKYAHKPWVIKWKGTVYHFYTAVGSQGRVIALATSDDLRKGR
jgi:predicted GH43/DUF377 family glycosyl hydrolase